MFDIMIKKVVDEMGIYYRIKEFMRGRAGVDTLGIVIITVALIISFIMNLLRVDMFGLPRIIVYALLALSFYRMLSKDIAKRARENDKFMDFINRFRKNKTYNGNGSFDTHFTTPKPKRDTKNYKYLKCPKCKAQLRVPRGKGKINVTCPKCAEKFKSKS